MIIRIYTLASTRNINDIHYVGKTKQELRRRLSQHLSSAKKYKEDNNYKNYNYNWINKELESGYDIIIEELDSLDFLDGADWEWFEQYWIAQMKIWGFSLTNLTDGGDGNKNQHFSKESIELRASKIRGIPRDEETKKKISVALTGIKRSEETKEKVRKSIVELQGVKIDQYTLNGTYIKSWDSIKEAADYYNTDPSNIGDFINNPEKRNHAVGFIWRKHGEELNLNKSNYVYQIDRNGNVTEWFNMNTAAKTLNIPCSTIYKCCTKELNSTNNCLFITYNDYINNNYDISKIRISNQVGQYDLDNNLIQIFKTCAEAGRILDINRKGIAKCCKGEIPFYKGFIFKYI